MSKLVVTATWDDVPHLSDQQKAELWEAIPPYQRDARSKGIPQLGSGAIYPVPESDLLEDAFDVPAWWPRSYGMDVGWNMTAVVWGALDPETDCLHLYAEYGRGQAEPASHAAAIRARGDWMMGTIDPASRGRQQSDGSQLLASYRDLGLNLTPADNGVESGLFLVYQRMTTARLKISKACVGILGEFRLYRRDEKGNVVKKMDHFMDAMRYLVVSGIPLGQPLPDWAQRMGHVPAMTSDYNPWGNP